MTFDETVDLLVVGSGAAGLVAGARAARHGAQVLLIEKGSLWGGTSATSGGGVWIPCSHYAEQVGQKDDPDDAFAYIRALTAPNVEDAQIRAYVDNADNMMRWIEEKAGAVFAALPYPDYHPEVPGSREGYRTHLMPISVPGDSIGREAFDTMQRSHQAANLFGRINWMFVETNVALFRPKGWWKTIGKMLGRYWLDVPQRLRSPRDRRLTLGTALLGLLRKAYDGAGGRFWLNSPLVSLIEKDGRVTGAVVRRDGREVRVAARRGVILAAGGFERNPELRKRHLKASADPLSSGSQVNNEGDAMIEAQRLGAATRNLDSAWFAPVFRVPGEDRARLSTMERALPHSIIINQAGRRYANEALSYHRFGHVMLQEDKPDGRVDPSWFVFDSRYRALYPAGPVLPLIPDRLLPKGVRQMMVKARSLAELAGKINVPAAVLEETILRFNVMAGKGKDEDFGRGDAAYDRLYGDPRVTPNPSLGAVDKPPYYAVPIYLGDIGTNGGLVTDPRARVLREDGSAIPGLYAIGNVAASVMGYSYPGAGATLGPGMTFGYLAAGDALGINSEG